MQRSGQRNPCTDTSVGVSSLAARKVLIVDDDSSIRDWLRACLEGEAYQVQEAASGAQALLQVAEFRPDLILMDIRMPGMDGIETTRRLKALRGTQTVPVIMVTSLHGREDRLASLQAGAEDFLTKPLDPVELTVRVRNLLRIKCYNDMLLARNRLLQEEVLEKTREVRQQCIDTVLTLTRAAEYRDENTGNHVSRISHYCVALAEALGLDQTFREHIFYASPMHDIGKLAIPDQILLKPGPFTREEWIVMQSHTTLGKSILEGRHSPYLEMGMDIAQSHHECWDGSGYPHGLKGEEIPLCSRLMAICDVYDALRSQRPYKQAMAHDQAISIMRQGDGRTRPEQFDPEVLQAFIGIHEQCREIYDEESAGRG